MTDMREERKEAAATRRRWVTLAELAALAGVVIAGLSYWNSHQERQDAAAERQIERAANAAERVAARHRVILYATAADNEGVTFKAQGGCPLQTSEIRFPSALHVPPQSTVIDHRIEADWVARPLLKLTDGGADRREGKLPVVIDASCTAMDGERSETAIYELLWRTEPGGFLRGRALRLRGMVRRPDDGGTDQARVDALWVREKPGG